MGPSERTKTVAFYLPQFHAIPENDEWWGKGFTEWVNVKRASPLFATHRQPVRPHDDIGYYELGSGKAEAMQASLARLYGIDAFCVYYYWFSGRRLLTKPIDAMASCDSSLPFFFSWANESWTRSWDGKSKSVLMPQGYESGAARALVRSMLPYMRLPVYLRNHGLPVLVIHRADEIPSLGSFCEQLRDEARRGGVGGLYLLASLTRRSVLQASSYFDGFVQFPPVGLNTIGSALFRPPLGLEREFKGRLLNYEALVAKSIKSFKSDSSSFCIHPGVAPSWDNTARRGKYATVYTGATPELYASWLEHVHTEESCSKGANGLVFINAWNEWAEGAYLEPDDCNGYAYLEATKRAVEEHGGDVGHLAIGDTVALVGSLLRCFGSNLSQIYRIGAGVRRG